MTIDEIKNLLINDTIAVSFRIPYELDEYKYNFNPFVKTVKGCETYELYISPSHNENMDILLTLEYIMSLNIPFYLEYYPKNMQLYSCRQIFTLHNHGNHYTIDLDDVPFNENDFKNIATFKVLAAV